VVEPNAQVISKPAFSPFEQDKGRKRFDEKVPEAAPVVRPAPVAAVAAATPVSVAAPAVVASLLAVEAPLPVLAPVKIAETNGNADGVERVEDLVPAQAALVAEPVEELPTEVVAEVTARPAAAPVVDMQPSGLHSADALQKAATEALLDAKNQDTPADAMADAEWVVADGEVRVQTELSKTMLPMVIGAEAEKIIKAALRDAGAGALKLVLLPGVKTASAAKKPRAAKSGSVQAKAMEHPIVQRAQTLFNAEIRNVIDLRDSD
jgi:DNA polymerase-3 subunit gamma/tau